MSKQYTKAEVAQHKDEKAMFIIIDDGVYDVAGMCFFSAFCFWDRL
jgi:cytochrome b involved in lipid metabolism